MRCGCYRTWVTDIAVTIDDGSKALGRVHVAVGQRQRWIAGAHHLTGNATYCSSEQPQTHDNPLSLASSQAHTQTHTNTHKTHLCTIVDVWR